MEFSAAKCPSCGGDLQLPTDKERVKCMYCGSDVIVKEALKSAAPTSKGLLSLADSAMKSGDYSAALEKLDKILEANPADAEAWYLRGTVLMKISGVNYYDQSIINSLLELCK